MFQNSAANVETRLRGMIKDVEGSMSDKTDEVFTLMRRDYRSVIGGDVPQQGQILPRDQRLVRKDVMRVIKGVERAFMKVAGVDVEDEKDEDEEDDLSDTEKAEPVKVKGEPGPSDQATHDQEPDGSASSAEGEAASVDGTTAAAAISEDESEASAQGLDDKVDSDTDVSNGSKLSDPDSID